MEKQPLIFEYLDVFKFLQAYYQYRKERDKGFSFETWASEIKFSSRSYLRMVILGKKRVSPQFTERFCNAAGFTEKEARYFQILTKYSQAGIQAEKKVYGHELIQILKTVSDRSTINDVIEFLSKPLYARLLVLVGFDDLTPTTTTFARLLDRPVDEVANALQKLHELDLVTSNEMDNQIHWRTSHKKFDVPENIGSVPIMRFHEASLRDSIEAFRQPKELRRYRSLLLPLSEDELKEFNSLLEEFASQQLARFQSTSYSGRRLFQVNLNIFSVAGSDAELLVEKLEEDK